MADGDPEPNRSATIEFTSDFDALNMLFKANQDIEAAELAKAEAKKVFEEHKTYCSNLKDGRDRLIVSINGYVIGRREENIQRGLFTEGLDAGPPREWFKGIQKPGEKPEQQGGANDGGPAPDPED